MGLIAIVTLKFLNVRVSVEWYVRMCQQVTVYEYLHVHECVCVFECVCVCVCLSVCVSVRLPVCVNYVTKISKVITLSLLPVRTKKICTRMQPSPHTVCSFISVIDS